MSQIRRVKIFCCIGLCQNWWIRPIAAGCAHKF